MSRVYRILRAPFSENPFDGEGAYRFGGRWSSRGIRLAYTAEHLSLAMIEYFVHVDSDMPPRDLVVSVAEVPARVSRSIVTVRQLPENWRQSPAPHRLTAIGDAFVAAQKAAILIVPSVLAPEESNWLINPRHPEFRHIRIVSSNPFRYDVRFFR